MGRKEKHHHQCFIGRNSKVDFSIRVDMLGTWRWLLDLG